MTSHRHRASDGASLYWAQEGEGPTVLLIHGGTGTSEYDWELVRAQLARSYRLVLPDLRGHGRSTDPTDRLSLPQVGRDVVSLLEDVGGCDAIIAFSIAASALLALLCRRAEPLTRAFVSIGASITGDASQVPRFVNGPWPEELKRLRHEHGTDSDHWWRLRAALAQSWSRHHVTATELDALDLPTLVVCGDRDRIEPVETALTLCRALPQGELLVLPRCGHFVPRERPAEFAVAVERFLSRALGLHADVPPLAAAQDGR